MFKKITILALLALYSFTSFGISVNLFYCCDNLKSISFEVQRHHVDCKLPKKNKDCCKDERFQIKISEDQLHHVLVFSAAPAPALLTPPAYYTFDILGLTSNTLRVQSGDSSPPLLPDRSILYSVFRI
ncbi:HYC_CC_PP family protein [Niabella insulamsoli]|uniref:HYC_CC_PP family protein n=1 Tax=Niabella insulamsoli TaxID=3144874 RepID=UPI0031FDCF14